MNIEKETDLRCRCLEHGEHQLFAQAAEAMAQGVQMATRLHNLCPGGRNYALSMAIRAVLGDEKTILALADDLRERAKAPGAVW